MRRDMNDPTLDTLALAVAEAPAAARTLFLNARDGAALRARIGVACEQGFKPHADALARGGFDVAPHVDGIFDQVWLLPTRQRTEARGQLVNALDRAAPGARVIASVANDEGARSIEADFKALFGAAAGFSKHHCRAFWADVDPARADRALADRALADRALADRALADRWRADDAPRRIADGRFLSRPGVFAWDRIDLASSLLAAHLPRDLAGHGADLGCGYGFLSSEVAAHCAGVTALDVYEAQAKSLAMARENLAGLGIPVTYHWHDVAQGIAGVYDFVVTNPPFHATGRADLPELGQAFVRAAGAALRSGGRLLLVANRHLPYERTLAERFTGLRVLADEQGFKVICATRGTA